MVKNIVLNIQKFCIHDGPGIRTVVFLKGCPLACQWCSNPASQNPIPEPVFFKDRCLSCGQCDGVCSAITFNGRTPQIDRSLCNGCGQCEETCPSNALEILGKQMSPDQVMEEVLKDAVFYRNSGGGVTLSGGEPLMQPEFAREILKRCKKLGIHTAVETAGCLPWKDLERIIQYTDLFLYDLKHLDDDEHMKGTGKGNAKIIDNLKHLCREESQIILRVPVIPGFNDSEPQIRQFAKFFLNLDQCVKKVELLPYHNLGMHTYELLGKDYALKKLEIPDKEYLLRLAKILEQDMKEAEISCRAVFGTAS